MSRRPACTFELDPGVHSDIAVLSAKAARDPQAKRLLQMTINTLQHVRSGGRPTKDLVFMTSYPDLSDCSENYVGAGEATNGKPSHRIIWRETPAEAPGGLPHREILTIGERANGKAFFVAGQRLGRPVGVPLADLAALPEPGIEPARQKPSERAIQTSAARTTAPEADFEPEI